MLTGQMQMQMQITAHLVSCDSHSHLIAHSEQQQPSLSAVDGDLADQLIEALRIQLLAHGADACLPGLHGRMMTSALSAAS